MDAENKCNYCVVLSAQSERNTALSSPTFGSQKRQVRQGHRGTAGPGHTAAPPQLLFPRRRRGWGSFEGSVEQRTLGGAFSQQERRRRPGSSSSFWSCLHTTWDGELTASRLPLVNSASCSSLGELPSPTQGSLHPNLCLALTLLSSPLPEVRPGPGGTPWAGPRASVGCVALDLVCLERVACAILGLVARRVSSLEPP